jgi:acetate---CoA ligase (ADP-forming)
MSHPLVSLFAPRSVAVLGASPRTGTTGNSTVRNLIDFGFKGRIFPIHPTASEVCGLPAYGDVASLPDVPDCAAVALSADKVVANLAEAADLGVRSAVIFASGFSEVGTEGKARQDELRALVDRTKLAVCGPNCLGLASIGERISLYSASLPEGIAAGGVAVLSHSGSGCIVVTSLARFGFSYVVSGGNCVSLDLADYIDFLAEDERTRVMALFVETIRDPIAFARAARKANSAGKAIVALKVGRSIRGAAAAAAHTGSLAGESAVYEDFFGTNGIIPVDDIDELAESVALMASMTRRPRGRGLGVINVSGGEIALTCDLAQTLGVDLPDLSPAAEARVRAALPSYGRVSNPLDATGTAVFEMAMYAGCIEGVASDPAVSMVAVSQDCPTGLGGRQATVYRALATTAAEVASRIDKPLVFYSNVAGGLHPSVVEPLLEAGVPVLQGARASLLAIRRLFEHAESSGAPRAEIALAPPQESWRKRLATGEALTEREAKHFLADHDIPVTREKLARNAGQAIAAALEMSFPVVLKIESVDLPHKSDVGGVKLGLRTPRAVSKAFAEIMDSVARLAPNARINGVLVQEMIAVGTEAIAGLSRQDPFGMAVVVGAGGVLVELLRDSALALAPIDEARAAARISETRLGKMLAGYRGAPAGDARALAALVAQLSEIGAQYGDWLEAIDLNPVHVGAAGEGVRVLDALIVPRKRLSN